VKLTAQKREQTNNNKRRTFRLLQPRAKAQPITDLLSLVAQKVRAIFDPTTGLLALLTDTVRTIFRFS